MRRAHLRLTCPGATTFYLTPTTYPLLLTTHSTYHLLVTPYHTYERYQLSPAIHVLRGTVESIADRGYIGSRAGLRLLTPPLQRRTHCTPGCAPLKRRKHSAARWTCAAASNVRSSPLCADMVCKSGNSSADALFTQGLMALMQPIICCVRAQSTREFVTEFSGGATPHRSGVAQS